MRRFEEISVLGDGAFGTVTKCRDNNTGDIVAIKKMKQRYATFDECLQLKEIKSLRKIKHENVVRLLQVFREDDHLFLVFEHLPNGCLLKTIQNHDGPFTEPEIRFIISQLLNGLNYVHRQGFFHRDIKPENLLWSGNTLKIADFGLAREIRSRPPYTEYVSTRWYRAPEIILRHEFYNSPVDIWAVGAIMAELYMMKPIFQGTSETDQLYKICSVLGTPSSTWPEAIKLANRLNMRLPQSAPVPLSTLMPNASPEALDLIAEMLRYDPSKRPNAGQALQHPFFKGEKCPIIQRNKLPSKTSAATAQPKPKPKPIIEDNDNDLFTLPSNDFADSSMRQNSSSYLINSNYAQPPPPKPMSSLLTNVTGIPGLDRRDPIEKERKNRNFLQNQLFDPPSYENYSQRDHGSRFDRTKPQSKLDRFVARPGYIAGQYARPNIGEPKNKHDFSFNDDRDLFSDKYSFH
ncbi:putative serine/threonine-protein kinase [Tritrichomonas foetus]|uniref:Serine/threonine-protein kinase n=1 Tax=Tritrichomonas foetus TaxID=1144522 RepID=A0A1J4L1Z0_9EUKA|nr:putative serine/threonine-protein kinase [Tritrichomonas foetus]|eukprot:OHT15966.1 putative serine/threonine-protein kinase [Tritrichomonas foetus]